MKKMSQVVDFYYAENVVLFDKITVGLWKKTLHSVTLTVVRVIKVLGEGGRTDERTASEDQLDADGYGS